MATFKVGKSYYNKAGRIDIHARHDIFHCTPTRVYIDYVLYATHERGELAPVISRFANDDTEFIQVISQATGGVYRFSADDVSEKKLVVDKTAKFS